MLPYACLDSLLYTDELRVYYSVQTQDIFGSINRRWVFDRIERGMITPVKKRNYVVAQQNEWSEDINGQTEEDLRINNEGDLFSPSEILVTLSNKAFIETAGSRKGLPTTYEVRSSIPVLGPFGEVLHFNIGLVRSIDQGILEDD